MPKLDYDKLTTEQANRIHLLKTACSDKFDMTDFSRELKMLILSIDPELALAEKHEIEDLFLNDQGEVCHKPGTCAIESPGEIPPRLAALTVIVLDAMAKNGDLDWVRDLLKDEGYKGAYNTETTNTETEDEKKQEPKTFITSYFGDNGDRVNSLIGPFDTYSDAEDYAIVKDLTGVKYYENKPVECDEDGNWV